MATPQTSNIYPFVRYDFVYDTDSRLGVMKHFELGLDLDSIFVYARTQWWFVVRFKESAEWNEQTK